MAILQPVVIILPCFPRWNQTTFCGIHEFYIVASSSPWCYVFSVFLMFQNRPEEDDGNKSSGPTFLSLAKISKVARVGRVFSGVFNCHLKGFRGIPEQYPLKYTCYSRSLENEHFRPRSSANVVFRIFVPDICLRLGNLQNWYVPFVWEQMLRSFAIDEEVNGRWNHPAQSALTQ